MGLVLANDPLPVLASFPVASEAGEDSPLFGTNQELARNWGTTGGWEAPGMSMVTTIDDWQQTTDNRQYRVPLKSNIWTKVDPVRLDIQY